MSTTTNASAGEGLLSDSVDGFTTDDGQTIVLSGLNRHDGTRRNLVEITRDDAILLMAWLSEVTS